MTPYEQQVLAASRGLDYANPPPPVPATGGFANQAAGNAYRYSPIADTLARWGVQANGPWQDIARFAPAMHQAERAGAAVRGAAGELTGIPAAGRAGEAFASGDVGRGAGEAMMAAPSRLLALPGMLLSSPAEAQQPDPRVTTIRGLEAEIGRREKTLQSYGNRQFPSTVARNAANRIEIDGIEAARGRIKNLQGELDAEFLAQRQREEAAARGADWARTPFQKRYPGALEGGVTATAIAGGVVPFFATRGRIRHHGAQVQALDDQIMAAVNRANNTTLRSGQTHAALARERTQAAHDARALLAQRDQLVQQGSGVDHGLRGHLGAAAGAGALTELPMAAALAHDYLAGRADPSGELYDKTLESVNVLEHPGQVFGRYAIPFGLGAAAGGAGHYLGSQGGNVPAGHAGAVDALKMRYTAPRRR